MFGNEVARMDYPTNHLNLLLKVDTVKLFVMMMLFSPHYFLTENVIYSLSETDKPEGKRISHSARMGKPH
jgi:hypothetical protein